MSPLNIIDMMWHIHKISETPDTTQHKACSDWKRVAGSPVGILTSQHPPFDGSFPKPYVSGQILWLIPIYCPYGSGSKLSTSMTWGTQWLGLVSGSAALVCTAIERKFGTKTFSSCNLLITTQSCSRAVDVSESKNGLVRRMPLLLKTL